MIIKWIDFIITAAALIIFHNTKNVETSVSGSKYGYKVTLDNKEPQETKEYYLDELIFDKEKVNRKESLFPPYSGDRLSAPAQLLESIILRDLGRFIRISNFLSSLGYDFGRYRYSDTALTSACKISGEVGYFLVAHLLSLGAPVNAYSEDMYTPLLLACKYKHKRVIKLLIEYGKCIIDCADSDGRTPLFYAISQMDKELLIYFLQKGSNANFRDLLGNTPLIHAVMMGNKKALKPLLSSGASPWLRNYAGYDPVTLAVIDDHIDFISILINNNNYSKQELSIRRLVPDYNYLAAQRLLVGVQKQVPEHILMELLEIEIILENVLICSVSDKQGFTLLWWSAKLYYTFFIQRLLQFYQHAQSLSEGHICNPHKSGNTETLPLEMMITQLHYNSKTSRIASKRLYQELLFFNKSNLKKTRFNVDLENIFTILYMTDPYSNRSFLLQVLYLGRNIDNIMRVFFGLPHNYLENNCASYINKDDINFIKFQKLIGSLMFQLDTKNLLINELVLDSNSNIIRKNNTDLGSSLNATYNSYATSISCIINSKPSNNNQMEFFTHPARSLVSPMLYPLLVRGETKTMEESNALSISVSRGNNRLVLFLANVYNQCIQDNNFSSLSVYRKLCMEAYYGALKMALKKYHPPDSISLIQKGVDISLYTLLRYRPNTFGEILMKFNYCDPTDEVIAIKLLQYVIHGFLPKLCYGTNVFQNFHHPSNPINYIDDQIKACTIMSLEYYGIEGSKPSPLEHSIKLLLNIPCDVSNTRFVDILVHSYSKNTFFLKYGWVHSQHIHRALNYIMDNPRNFDKLDTFTNYLLPLLGFSPYLTNSLLYKFQFNDISKPIYYYFLKRSLFTEFLLDHPLFTSITHINRILICIIISTFTFCTFLLILVLATADHPIAYCEKIQSLNESFTQHKSSFASSQSVSSSGSSLKAEEILHRSPLKKYWFKFLNKFYTVLFRLCSYLFYSGYRAIPSLLFIPNLSNKPLSNSQFIWISIKCTLFGNYPIKELNSNLVGNCDNNSSIMKNHMEKSTLFKTLIIKLKYIQVSLLRIFLWTMSSTWLFQSKNFDLGIVIVYLALFSIFINMAFLSCEVSAQDKDKFYHLFVPSNLKFLRICKYSKKSSNSESTSNQCLSSFQCTLSCPIQDSPSYSSTNSIYSRNNSINLSLLNDRVGTILDKYSSSLLSPTNYTMLPPSHYNISRRSHTNNTLFSNFLKFKDLLILPPLFNGKNFWMCNFPSYKKWRYKEVFSEYYYLWLSLQSQNNYCVTFDSSKSSRFNSPNNATMTSQNPFEAINNRIKLEEDEYITNNTYNSVGTNSIYSASPTSSHDVNRNSAKYLKSLAIQNSEIESHLLAICQNECIFPNDCRRWYILQWCSCILIGSSYSLFSLYNAKNLYYRFLQYPTIWNMYGKSWFITIIGETMTSVHISVLAWNCLNPLGILWVTLVQRYRVFTYITKVLKEGKRKSELSRMNETLILRQLTLFLTLWNFIICRNNSFLQITLHNKYLKAVFIFFFFLLSLHFFLVRSNPTVVVRSQLLYTLFIIVLVLFLLAILFFGFIILLNHITKNISASINAILHAFYHNKLFHLFLKREIAILSAKKHDAFLYV
ncbi:hypothetical protein ACR3K2_11460 [Cryptosporidium serpentis]